MSLQINVAAIVVTYQPELSTFRKNLLSVVGQVPLAVVVDNASEQQTQLTELCDEVSQLNNVSVETVALQGNLGLGAAHNLGIDVIRRLQHHNVTHVLILDQDSLIAPNYVSNLIGAWQQLSTEENLGAVGGCYNNTEKTAESFFVRFGRLKFKRAYCLADNNRPVQADFLISSGTMFSLEALDLVGSMDESLFIDHVDTEWFLRAAHRGYVFFGVCQARMTHSLGEKLHRVKLIRERHVPQHKPFRYYYIFRNSIHLYKQAYVSKRWIWNDIQRLVLIFVMYGLVVGPRRENLKMMWRGIVDGFRGKLGRLSDG